MKQVFQKIAETHKIAESLTVFVNVHWQVNVAVFFGFVTNVRAKKADLLYAIAFQLQVVVCEGFENAIFIR